jgi:VWFA-related protein
MLGRKILLTSFLAWALIGQQQAPPVESEVDKPFGITVDVVLAPVTVLDRDGNFVNGLQPQQFRLLDNGKEQDIRVDVAFQPISLVIAIQANSEVEGILPQIQKVGSLIGPLVIGEQGEAAVLAFDHRIQTLQEFTSDATKIQEALKKIRAGSTTSRLVDAVDRAVRMLNSRPRNRRRIILLISETRDKGSEGKIRNALIDAQLTNVSIYAVPMNRLVAKLTSKPQPPRPDPLPPAMRPLPPGVPPTPTSVAQATGGEGGRAEFVPLMVEIFKDAKAIFVDNPVEVLTKGTGGSEFSFTRQRALEDAISRIGEELHSQYLISYSPNNKLEGGFHQIEVAVDRRDLRVHTRPGYWLAARP